MRDCIGISHQYGGIPSPSAKHFYASVLFTSLVARGVSLAILAPHSPWADKIIEHWDYASASVIVRTMTELRAAFYYLCIKECTDQEWNCRWNLLNLHDCVSRKRMLAAREPNSEEPDAARRTSRRTTGRLRDNSHFKQLQQQRKLLNGETAYLLPIEEMAERAGLDRSTYRFLNVLFSSHVHGLPMSYYRMGEQVRPVTRFLAKGTMANGRCKLIGTKGKFVKSHLIPKALTRHEEPGLPLIQGGSGKRRKLRWDSWYDSTW